MWNYYNLREKKVPGSRFKVPSSKFKDLEIGTLNLEQIILTHLNHLIKNVSLPSEIS
jgi:hypothetical protein